MKTTMKLTVIAIVILTMLMACTPAGTPLSMVGQWNLTEEGGDGTFYQIPSNLPRLRLLLKVPSNNAA